MQSGPQLHENRLFATDCSSGANTPAMKMNRNRLTINNIRRYHPFRASKGCFLFSKRAHFALQKSPFHGLKWCISHDDMHSFATRYGLYRIAPGILSSSDIVAFA